MSKPEDHAMKGGGVEVQRDVGAMLRESAQAQGRIPDYDYAAAQAQAQARPTDFDSPAPNAAEVKMAAAHYITSSECYDMARREWMPAAAKEALVRAARTIAALEPRGARPVAALERK